MHITGIHYHSSQKIGLKDNIFKLHLHKVYLIQPWWYTKIILSPSSLIWNDFNSLFIFIINKI